MQLKCYIYIYITDKLFRSPYVAFENGYLSNFTVTRCGCTVYNEDHNFPTECYFCLIWELQKSIIRPTGIIFPIYCFLGNGREKQAEQSDVIWTDCCNQHAVLGRNLCSNPDEGNQSTILIGAIWMFIFLQP